MLQQSRDLGRAAAAFGGRRGRPRPTRRPCVGRLWGGCKSLEVHTSTVCLCPQSLMLAKAKEEWDQEIVDKQSEKERYLAERVTPLHTSGLSLSQLQVFLRPERGASSSGAQGLAFTAPPLCSAPRTCAGSCTRRLRLWTRSGMTSKPNATTTPGR